MIDHEPRYDTLPPYIQLPESIREGLDDLWTKSTYTQTEWVCAILHANGKYEMIPLGHQAEGMVTVSVVDLLQAKPAGRKIDREFFDQEISESKMEIRYTPNEEGIYYKGAILYLLPQQILQDQSMLALMPDISPPDMIKAKEHFFGTAHSHSGPHQLSHLPSSIDARRSVLGKLHTTFDLVVSQSRVSLLLKTQDTPDFTWNPNRAIYLSQQELSDKIDLANGRPFLDLLQSICASNKLGLYEGDSGSNEPILSVFRNLL